MPFAPPAKAEISATPSPNNGVAKVGLAKLYDYVTSLLGLTGEPADARAALGAIGNSDAPPAQFLRKNAIINGGFTVNQRVYASAAVLAAGAYGHDRWKGGAGGGNYTFAQLAHNTTITIAAGKSLIQVVEDKNVVGGAYILSWTGTAQARAGINTATPAGAYAASPLVIAGQTAGTVMSVEFNEGTLGKVQLEAGSVATGFEQRMFNDELALCQRYYTKSFNVDVAPGTASALGAVGASGNGAAQGEVWAIQFKQTMRAIPTIVQYSPTTGASGNIRNMTAGVDVAATANTGQLGMSGYTNAGVALTAANSFALHYTASAEL